MQVINIQNENINFNARLKLTGHIEDIGKETKKMWEKRAKSIGTKKDLITLHFGTFMTESGCNFIDNSFQNWKASIRAIYATAMIDGIKLYNNKYIGYRAINTPHSCELRDAKVTEFLDKLGCV